MYEMLWYMPLSFSFADGTQSLMAHIYVLSYTSVLQESPRHHTQPCRLESVGSHHEYEAQVLPLSYKSRDVQTFK